MGVLEQAALRQAKGQTFALATVVRTVSVTAAKAGAKALIGPDGSIEEGWIGGGCARAAVVKAARQCMAGRPIAACLDRAAKTRSPNLAQRQARSAGAFLRQEFLPEPGNDGRFCRAGLAEPAPPDPRRFASRRGARETGAFDGLCGDSRRGARRTSAISTLAFRASRVFRLRTRAGDDAFVVVSTQGAGDRAALKSAAAMNARYRAFVGSRRKAETLEKRTRQGGRLRRSFGRDQGAGRARHLRDLRR